MMAAVELGRDLRLTLVERDTPRARAGEALVRVEWAGLCGSDLHVMRSGAWVEDWPAVLGHELCGVVEAAGLGVALSPGTRVVADSRVPCGDCEACATDPDRCPYLRFVGEALPGGFATHVVLPARLLHPVPDGLDPSVAVLAEPLAVAVHALGHVAASPRRALILGHGPIGALIHIELLRRWPGAAVTVAEPAPLRAALARALGARTLDAADAARHDLVIDAAGYRGSLADAVAACAPGAHLLLVALSDHPVQLTPIELAERRIRLTGCNGFVDELPAALALLAAEAWRYLPIITEAVTLGELPDVARRQLERPDAVKVLVRP